MLTEITPTTDHPYRHLRFIDNESQSKDGYVELLPDEHVEGLIAVYDPEDGGWDYDQKPCGHVMLQVEGEEKPVKVTLDKPRLISVFETLANTYTETHGSPVGAFVRLTYEGSQRSKKDPSRRYKIFKVGHDEELYNPTEIAKALVEDELL